MSENLKTLLQQALDMLEEQALHIEAPMLPAGEELLNRIRDALSQQAEQQPILAVKAEADCVEHVHPEYGGGYFFTEDAIVEMYAAPIAQTEQQRYGHPSAPGRHEGQVACRHRVRR